MVMCREIFCCSPSMELFEDLDCYWQDRDWRNCCVSSHWLLEGLNVSLDKRCFAIVGSDLRPDSSQHKLTHEPLLSELLSVHTNLASWQTRNEMCTDFLSQPTFWVVFKCNLSTVYQIPNAVVLFSRVFFFPSFLSFSFCLSFLFLFLRIRSSSVLNSVIRKYVEVSFYLPFLSKLYYFWLFIYCIYLYI